MKKIEVVLIAVLTAIYGVMLYLAVPAAASVTDSPTDAQYGPPNITTEPGSPPDDTIGVLPFTGSEAIAALIVVGIILLGVGALMRHGAVKRRDDDELIREREEAGWSPRMDWNWPRR